MMSTENCSSSRKQYCILFYKYHPLTDNPELLETYRHATEILCTSLQLTGRILIGLSNDGEGINGTLAGTKDDLDAYVDCMLNRDVAKTNLGERRAGVVATFREASIKFFTELNLHELFLSSPNDFKWSSWSKSSLDDNNSGLSKDGENWFPDLNIKIVKEIISSGGAFAGISTKDTSVGYLTPQEWHKEIQSLIENKKKKEQNSLNNGKGGAEDTTDDEIETILVDVRNHKECQIGSFAPGISIDPQTKTFAQFPKWVKDKSNGSEMASSEDTSAATASAPSLSLLNNRRILMYCTGGIRCEKASAYIRQVVPENKGIYHLKGGIHKYLEEFGRDALTTRSTNESDVIDSKEEECLFVGKNFVFDRRGALDAETSGKDPSSSPFKSNSTVIGKCQYCSDPFDAFHPENVCTVCREPILVCEKCQLNLYQKQRSLRGLTSSTKNGDSIEDDSKKKSNCRAEYHCQDHFHLNSCYFTSLHGFERNELGKQLDQLQLHSKPLESIGRKGKQRRKTLRKQMDKIDACVKDNVSNDKGESSGLETVMQCRHCGSSTCTSDCWGFHGGNTRMANKNKKNQGGDNKECANDDKVELKKHKQRTRLPSNQRPAKGLKRQIDISEIDELQLSNPPSQHRNEATGLRVPPPVIRILRSGVKGRWCGKTVHWVLNNEFGDWHSLPQAERDERLDQLIAAGLIRINGVPISKKLKSATSVPSPVKASDIVLRNMDTIERIVHWHEPPISIPSKIWVTKHSFRGVAASASLDESTVCPSLYCINKPSSVPIYPAGPYYSNSLLLMVEAQEGLPPKTLIPLHRIDRAASGILLCANMSSVASVVQGRMASSINENENDPPVRKLYLARVRGRFPNMPSESPTIPKECESIVSVAWCGEENNIIEIDAPIAVRLESKKNKSKGSNEDENPSNTMMLRSVHGDGKKSISRFKLISYDRNTNQSLVSCCPITGRGHQLRIHLKLIGHPIHNDVEYEGRVDAESVKEQERISAQSILDVSTATTECRHEKVVTADEVKAAVQLCRCCSGGLEGVKTCFSSGQLLGCGHAIDLHAHKYCISFKPNKSNEDESSHDISRGKMDNVDKRTMSMEFAAGLPSWASSFFAGLTPNDSLAWLN